MWMNLLMIILIICVCTTTSTNTSYTLYFDDAPRLRWKDMVRDILHSVGWDMTYGKIARDTIDAYNEIGCTNACQTELAKLFQKRYPVEYEELAGIAEVFAEQGHDEIMVNDLAAWQFYYELSHVQRNGVKHKDKFGCTSVLAINGNTVVHGRNLDIPDADDYRLISAHVKWVKNGTKLFESTQNIAENTGIATGVTNAGENGFSFSYNWRRDENDTTVSSLESVLNCIRAIDKTKTPLISYVRSLFEDGVTGTQAEKLLSDAMLCAPAYIAVGSAHSGMILTRNSTHSIQPNRVANDTSSWHISQTNYDYFGPQPTWDDRYHLAEETFESLGQHYGATQQGIWKVLSIPSTQASRGVLNDDTVYSSFLCPINGTLFDMIRWPSKPRNDP